MDGPQSEVHLLANLHISILKLENRLARYIEKPKLLRVKTSFQMSNIAADF
jgi:hypothetical protein